MTQPFPPASADSPQSPFGGGETLRAAAFDPEAAEAAPLLVTQQLTIPDGVSSNSKQHVVFVRDRSGSMGGRKIKELNQASVSLQRELADPVNKDGFVVSVIDFSDGAETRCVAEPAAEMTMPTAHSGGGTNFDAAILQAIDAVQAVETRPNPEGWRYLRPQVLFLSDGHSNVSDYNIAQLQEMATVLAIAYGSDAAKATLARIASDNQVHVVGTNGAALRRFLTEVGKTLSQGLASAR